MCTLIIGIGNMYRSDDAAGLIIAQLLKNEVTKDVSVIEKNGDGVALMESWKHAVTVIIIDAVYSGVRPGTIHRFDARTHQIPSNLFQCSTHAFGIAEAIELARSLDQLPQNIIMYGVEGKNFKAGIGVSPEVEEAAWHVANRILQDIHAII